MQAVAIVASATLIGGLTQAAPAAAAPRIGPTHEATQSTTSSTSSSGVTDPEKKLGKGWKTSSDRAVTAAADTDGLHLLVADSSKAYTWKTAAVLSEPGMPADSWIGNECVMDRTHAAVVYAPRTFTNKPDLMQGGAFAAIVNLDSGQVSKLPFTASLAYFDPSCNPHSHTAAFTAFRGMNDPAKTKTRVLTVNTTGKVTSKAATKGEVTSAVPVDDGTVAALGRRLIHLDHSGRVKPMLTAGGLPFDIHPTKDGSIAFVERNGGKKARARVWNKRDEPSTIATGKLGAFDLQQAGTAQVFLTGRVTGNSHTRARGVTRVDAPTGTDISSNGRLAIAPVLTPGMHAGLARIKNAGKGFSKAESGGNEETAQSPETLTVTKPLTVTSTVTSTGTKITQSVTVPASPNGMKKLSPALTATSKSGSGTGNHTQTVRAMSVGVSHDPTDPDRWCSVSRNDLHAQALQPTPNQVEWAVDMAVRGDLRASYIRQGGYRSQAGLGTIDPQGLFPLPTLTGGGRIPANVMLGIMAQESNLWQAEGGTIPGQMGNPLAAVDGYYGHKPDPGDPNSYWNIHWDESDCGYGVGQVTDGMRLAGHEKGNETSLSPSLQKLVAVDYATNIAASLKILADKWNEVHKEGQKVTVNNDDPSRVENWFTAAWNYNLGFNPPSDASNHDGHWGLGWYNNPANPIYKKSWGHPFMDTDHDGTEANKDAAHPQDWPYEEKVMGWAAWSIDTGFSYSTSGRQDWPGESGFSSAGFRPAWWTSSAERSKVSPDLTIFCNANNNCDSLSPPNCPDADCYAQYWWNKSNATWKDDCDTTCGHENIKYLTLVDEPGRGYRLKNGEPVCTGAPTGSHVVASVPQGTETWSDCKQVTSAGSFQFTFYPDTLGTHYEAKADLHQIGGGFDGHFWYAKTRNVDHLGGSRGEMTIDGTWTLGQSANWARVLVHLPDTGAQTRQATYVVGGSDSLSPKRVVLQRAGGWVSLGVFHFTGTPTVSLSNSTADGTADEDIAWGAVAFQPLGGKPANSIVAMGDSYSSGEAATTGGGDDYYPETDYYNSSQPSTEDKCHRSKYAWSRQATLPGYSSSIGSMGDNLDPQMDYHFVACSGARTYNILSKEQGSDEVTQIDSGYLDQNTTLVPLSIGGNDMRFSDIIQDCILSLTVCTDDSLESVNPNTGDKIEGQSTGPMNKWASVWAHDTVRPLLVKTINEIHKKAKNAKIVLMGYPRLLEREGICVPGIGTAEGPWLNEMADTLATEMKGAVEDANAQYQDNAVFSDPRDEFSGKAICGDPEDVNGVVLSGYSKADSRGPSWFPGNPNPSMKSFHPKIPGAGLYATAFEHTLAGS